MFNFRFETLLKIRKTHEDKAKQFYAERLKTHQDELNFKMNLELQLKKCYSERTQLDRFFLSEERILFLKQALVKQNERIAYSQGRLNEALAQFLEVKKKKEILEKLKEKDAMKFKRDKNKKELKHLDYIYMISHKKSEL